MDLVLIRLHYPLLFPSNQLLQKYKLPVWHFYILWRRLPCRRYIEHSFRKEVVYSFYKVVLKRKILVVLDAVGRQSSLKVLRERETQRRVHHYMYAEKYNREWAEEDIETNKQPWKMSIRRFLSFVERVPQKEANDHQYRRLFN